MNDTSGYGDGILLLSHGAVTLNGPCTAGGWEVTDSKEWAWGERKVPYKTFDTKSRVFSIQQRWNCPVVDDKGRWVESLVMDGAVSQKLEMWRVGRRDCRGCRCSVSPRRHW